MCMSFALLFGVSPLLAFVSANIWGYLYDCGPIIKAEITCYKGDFIASLFSLSWYWVITLPIGLILFGVFYFLYLTVRRK